MKNVNTVKRGWALLRVSTTAQANIQHGSLEQQRHMIERWAKNQSEMNNSVYQITRFIEEDVSGRGSSLHKRPELHELERVIQRKQIDFFVVEKLDRMARDQIFNLQIVKMAHTNQVEVHEFESGLINLSDRGSRLGFNIKNMMAEEYSLELEEKITKKQREARVNNGKDTSTCPILGLDPHLSKRGMYVINPEEQKIVIDIFKQFKKLGSLQALEDYCLKQGYKSKSRLTKEKTDREGTIIPPRKMGGELLDGRSLRRILVSSKLRGFAFFKDTWNQFPNLQNEEGFVRWEYAHGPVVDLDLFMDCWEVLQKNSINSSRPKSGAVAYLLSGILEDENGLKYHGESANSGKNHYYVHKEDKSRIPKEKIEKIICERVKMYLGDNDVIKKLIETMLKNNTSGLPNLDKKIVDKKKIITELECAVEGFSRTLRKAMMTPGIDDNDSIWTELLSEKRKTEDELSKIRNEVIDLEVDKKSLKENFSQKSFQNYLNGILDGFDKKNDLEKKQLIQAVVQSVIYDRVKNTLELKIAMQEKKSPKINENCHIDGAKNRVKNKWRERNKLGTQMIIIIIKMIRKIHLQLFSTNIDFCPVTSVTCITRSKTK